MVTSHIKITQKDECPHGVLNLHIRFLHQKRANHRATSLVNRRMDRSCNLVRLMWFGADLSPALSSIRTIANPRQPDRSHSRTSLILPARAGPSAGGAPPLGPPASLSPSHAMLLSRLCYAATARPARLASRRGPTCHRAVSEIARARHSSTVGHPPSLWPSPAGSHHRSLRATERHDFSPPLLVDARL